LKKIAIDARPLSRPRSGIRRYLEKILEVLLEKSDIRWYLYSDKPLRSSIIQPHHNVVVRVTGREKLARIMWFWVLHKWIRQDSPNTYWSPRHHLPRFLPPGVRKVVTIHDLVWRTLPATMRWSSLFAERLATPYSIKIADRIVAVSESTAADVRQLMPESCDKITVLHHGKSDLHTLSTETTPRYQKNPYFLSVGTVEPRKNFVRLMTAYSIYRKNGGANDLVIVGNRGWGWKAFEQTRSKLNLGGSFKFVENCDDENLSRLYRHAEAFVMVSLGEGYGLPVAEAEQFDLAMLLSDLPVFHEVNPSTVLWVDEMDPQAIANGLANVCKPDAQYEKGKTAPHQVEDWEQIAGRLFLTF